MTHAQWMAKGRELHRRMQTTKGEELKKLVAEVVAWSKAAPSAQPRKED